MLKMKSSLYYGLIKLPIWRLISTIFDCLTIELGSDEISKTQTSIGSLHRSHSFDFDKPLETRIPN